MDTGNSVVITGQREWVEVEEGVRELNGNGKQYKNNFKK